MRGGSELRARRWHDGRYATLLDLLRGSDGTMGHTSHLGPEDMQALATYLEFL